MSLPFEKITQRVINFDSSHSESAKKLEESGILPSPSRTNYTSTDIMMEITSSNINIFHCIIEAKNIILILYG